jgi:hypothetical protein
MGPMIIPVSIEPRVSAQIGVPEARYDDAMLMPIISGIMAIPNVENSILSLDGFVSAIFFNNVPRVLSSW